MLSIKNTGITNYGTARFSNVEDALGGIKEFLPYGYQLAQKNHIRMPRIPIIQLWMKMESLQ